jgi:hypothetical protein
MLHYAGDPLDYEPHDTCSRCGFERETVRYREHDVCRTCLRALLRARSREALRLVRVGAR